MDVLPGKALAELEKKFAGKEIMVVETGYPYKWEVPGTTHDVTKDYPYTEAGQDKYVADLVKTLHEYPDVDGLFWWWLEYNAYGAGLSNWYNAPSSTARQESDPSSHHSLHFYDRHRQRRHSSPRLHAGSRRAMVLTSTAARSKPRQQKESTSATERR